MLMPSPPAMPAAAAEAEDEESCPQARLASRILSGPGLWLDWLEQIDRRGLVEELLAEGIIDQAVATTNPLCGAGNSLSVIGPPCASANTTSRQRPAIRMLLLRCILAPAARTLLHAAMGVQRRRQRKPELEGLCAAHGPSARPLAGTESAISLHADLKSDHSQ
jgi:hypothetical protein